MNYNNPSERDLFLQGFNYCSKYGNDVLTVQDFKDFKDKHEREWKSIINQNLYKPIDKIIWLSHEYTFFRNAFAHVAPQNQIFYHYDDISAIIGNIRAEINPFDKADKFENEQIFYFYLITSERNSDIKKIISTWLKSENEHNVFVKIEQLIESGKKYGHNNFWPIVDSNSHKIPAVSLISINELKRRVFKIFVSERDFLAKTNQLLLQESKREVGKIKVIIQNDLPLRLVFKEFFSLPFVDFEYREEIVDRFVDFLVLKIDGQKVEHELTLLNHCLGNGLHKDLFRNLLVTLKKTNLGKNNRRNAIISSQGGNRFSTQLIKALKIDGFSISSINTYLGYKIIDIRLSKNNLLLLKNFCFENKTSIDFIMKSVYTPEVICLLQKIKFDIKAL